MTPVWPPRQFHDQGALGVIELLTGLIPTPTPAILTGSPIALTMVTGVVVWSVVHPPRAHGSDRTIHSV